MNFRAENKISPSVFPCCILNLTAAVLLLPLGDLNAPFICNTRVYGRYHVTHSYRYPHEGLFDRGEDRRVNMKKPKSASMS